VAQDAELRQLARKYAKEYALLDTLGNAQENSEITRRVVKLIHEQAGAMEKETGVESSMIDDNQVRQYLELVIRETREKKG
jgi:fructose/tagatose bisphosphate aldolase